MARDLCLSWTDEISSLKNTLTVDFDHVDKSCISALGHQSLPSCEHISGELSLTGNRVLDPKDGPYIRFLGDCAVAIGFRDATAVAWSVMRAVLGSFQT